MDAMKEAIRLYYSGEVFEAEKILKSILAQEPENIGALIRYATIQGDLGRRGEAGSIYLKLARLYEKESNDEECLEALNKAAATISPIDLAPLKGACLFRLGRYEEALENFNLCPRSMQVLLYMGKAHLALHQYELALSVFREALAKGTGNEEIFQACYWIGKSQFYLGNLPEAIECLQSYVSVYPHELQVYLDLALCFLNQDSLTEAETSLLKYHELGGSLEAANLYLGIVYCRMGKYEQAVGYLEQTILSEQSMYWKGLAYYELGLYEEALACFLEAAKMDAKPLYTKMTGKTYLKLGNYFEAKFCFEKALSDDPADEELDKLAAIARHYLKTG